MNAKTIRDALRYEAKNNLFEHGAAAAALLTLAHYGTDAEMIRFAQLIGNVTEGSERPVAPPMDSAELSRANAD